MNLHVDQKEASYEGSSAHSGDYEGPVVRWRRLVFVQGLKSAPAAQHQALNPKPQNKQISQQIFLTKKRLDDKNQIPIPIISTENIEPESSSIDSPQDHLLLAEN